jgi:hypothetical protein
MKAKFLVIAFAVSSLFSFPSQAQTADSGFPKGELSTAKNHTGNIWLSELNLDGRVDSVCGRSYQRQTSTSRSTTPSNTHHP